MTQSLVNATVTTYFRSTGNTTTQFTSKIYYSLMDPQLLHSISLCGYKFHALFCTTDSMKSWTDPAPPFSRVTQTFPECLRRLSITLGGVPRSIWQHSPKYWRTFPGMRICALVYYPKYQIIQTQNKKKLFLKE